MGTGIHSLPLDQTPITVLDFETTGLSPRAGARVVEVAVVRLDPGAAPKLVLDTLIDPQTEVRCSSIHGIYDHDVLGAPIFAEIAGPIAHAISGSVVAIFNASFDTQFLEAETRRTRRLDRFTAPPHVCMMYLRPALGIGDRTSLDSALRAANLPVPDHRAAHDALATAHLWQWYRDFALETGMKTFGAIAERKRYKFMQSWESAPYTLDHAASIGPATTQTALMSRMTPLSYPPAAATAGRRAPAREGEDRSSIRSGYLRALIDATQDSVLDGEEIVGLQEFQRVSGITKGEVRAVHAAFFADVLKVCVEDGFLSHQEARNVEGLRRMLAALGWAPGDLSEASA
jgi:hypothetical protein